MTQRISSIIKLFQNALKGINILRSFHSGLIVFFLILFFLPPDVPATEGRAYISIVAPDPESETADFNWTLEPSESGVKSILVHSFAKPKEIAEFPGTPGWEYRIETDDGMVMVNRFHDASENRVEQIIPLETLPNDTHTLTLTIRDFNGTRHQRKKTVELNGTPQIRVVLPEKAQGIFEPEITFTFFGQRNEFIGWVDIYLDNRFLNTASFSADQNKSPVRLSELTGSPIYPADLSPGNHLLTLIAHGINSSRHEHLLTIPGSTVLPEIRTQYAETGTFEQVTIDFPESSRAVVGTVQIHYNHSIILAVNTDKPHVSISRSDLLTAFSTHQLTIGNTPVSLILSALSANQVENWQPFNFN